MTSAPACGVRIAGAGSAVPDGVLSNADFERMLDTSDEWIVKRTGIRERRVVDPKCEGTYTLSRDALERALDHAGIAASELDTVILATVTAEMTCPSNACRVAQALGNSTACAFDLVAACSGFVYALNIADTLIRSGRHGCVGVIGCDAMSTVIDYEDRSVSILFGDAAGAVILTPDADPTIGCIHQTMHADASNWGWLYLPRREDEVPDDDRDNPIRLGNLRMHGREVYKWGVIKLRDVLQEALDSTGLKQCDISQFVCHQSNLRIIEAVREKLGLPKEKMWVNIDSHGNSSAGSVGCSFDEAWKSGRFDRGDTVVLAAIGGGMTWANSVWKL